MRTFTRAVAMLAAALALSSLLLTAARADAVIPHSDPIVAAKQMRHGGPLPPSISTNAVTANEQWRRYQDEVAAATERAIHDRFQHAGPWEAIAAQQFGVYAKPEATGWTAMPVPSDHPAPPSVPASTAPTPASPVSAPPAIHSPVHVAPVPPKTTASPVPATATAVEPHAPTPSPSPSPSPGQKPILPHDTIMRLIKQYTELIAQYRAKHPAEAEKAQRIADAAAAWAAANPPKPHHDTAEPSSVPAPHHHRFGVPTHKRPPLPAHVTPMPAAARRVEFALKFSGVCVDSATAKAMGKHANPHNHQPLHHHLKHHRRGAHAKAERPSQEVPYCSLKAQSQEIMTRIHPNAGVDMSVTKMVGSVARLELFDLSILSESEFVARGNVSFGSTRHKSHSVAMESAGSARVFKFKTGERAFTAQFQVTDGGGGFENHRGLITLNAVWSSPTRVEALVTGSLYPPEDLNARRMSALKPSPFYRHSSATKQQPVKDDCDDDDDDDVDGGDAKSKAKTTKPSPIRLRV